MAFLWKYWNKSASAAVLETDHSNASSEDFVYNEYRSKEPEKRGTLHHVRRQAPLAHGQSETRRLMHRRSRRREEAEDLESLRDTIKEQSRRSNKERSLCHVRERTTSVSQPIIQSSTSSNAHGRTGHMARVWNVDSQVESVNFVVGKPRPARLREVRTYNMSDESDASSMTTDSSSFSAIDFFPVRY